MQPPPVTKGFIEKAIADVGKKKKLSALPDLRFEELAEGTCAKILHIAGSPKKVRRSSESISSFGHMEASEQESITRSI